MVTLVYNGWAAGLETWSLTSFHRDWTFNYLEELDEMPERVIRDFDEILLVGFSMGSSMALRTVCRHPEKIKGLVLVSATPRMMEDRSDAAHVWAGFSPRRLKAFRLGTEMVFGNNPDPLYAHDNLERGLKFLEITDLRADLERLVASPAYRSFPVRILHSARDGIVRPHNAEYLKRIFPQAKVTMVPGCEHVLPVTAPELIDQAVKEIGGN